MENITEKKYLRKFVCSDDLFSGFGVEIDITQMDSIIMIISKFCKELGGLLREHNFENLLIEYNKKRFHLHDKTIEDILISDPDEIFYICHH
jgi:hypothetical protein